MCSHPPSLLNVMYVTDKSVKYDMYIICGQCVMLIIVQWSKSIKYILQFIHTHVCSILSCFKFLSVVHFNHLYHAIKIHPYSVQLNQKPLENTYRCFVMAFIQ